MKNSMLPKTLVLLNALLLLCSGETLTGKSFHLKQLQIHEESLMGYRQISFYHPGYCEKWLTLPDHAARPVSVTLNQTRIFLGLLTNGIRVRIPDIHSRIREGYLHILGQLPSPMRAINLKNFKIRNQFGKIRSTVTPMAEGAFRLKIPLYELDNFSNILTLLPHDFPHQPGANLLLFEGLSPSQINKLEHSLKELAVSDHFIHWNADNLGLPTAKTIARLTRVLYINNSARLQTSFLNSLSEEHFNGGLMVVRFRPPGENESRNINGINCLPSSYRLRIKNRQSHIEVNVHGGLFFRKEYGDTQLPFYHYEKEYRFKILNKFQGTTPALFHQTAQGHPRIYLGHMPWHYQPVAAGVKVWRKALWFLFYRRKGLAMIPVKVKFNSFFSHLQSLYKGQLSTLSEERIQISSPCLQEYTSDDSTTSQQHS